MSGDTQALITSTIQEFENHQQTVEAEKQMQSVVSAVASSDNDTLICPTCHGSGRITREAFHAGRSSLILSSNLEVDVPVDPDIYKKIRRELNEQNVTQEVFAAVSFGRTQGALSDLLRKAEEGVPANHSMRQHLGRIQDFLTQPVKQRLKMYRDYMMETKDKRRLRKEYYGVKGAHQTQKTSQFISAHAKAVMLEFYNRISSNPDLSGLQIMSEVLNLDKDVIQRFFKIERKKNKEQTDDVNDDDVDEDVLADVDEDKEGGMNEMASENDIISDSYVTEEAVNHN